MRREFKIALSASIWLAIAGPILYFSVTPPQAEISSQIDELSLPNASAIVRIQASAEHHPDLPQAAAQILNREFKSTKFEVFDTCTPEMELCISGKLAENDELVLSPDTRYAEFNFSPDTLAAGRVAQMVAMIAHKYYDPLEFNVMSHKEVTVGYSPKYHITFSLLGEGGLPLKWDISSAIKKYMDPLLGQLSTKVADFSIDTQTGIFAKLGCERQPELTHSMLSTFVNSAEWPLTSTNSYPSLNFVLYVPSSDLQVLDSPTNSFILPQWGGVIISKVNQTDFSASDLEPALNLFSSQLLALLGMREVNINIPNEQPPLEAKISHLARERIREGLSQSIQSLKSLKRLVHNAKNFPIPVEVQQQTTKAVASINLASDFLVGGYLEMAKQATAQAFIDAEKAFFNKHMIEQAYFPNEHKLAVYVPLVGPISLVVLGSWMRLRRQEKALREVEEKNNKANVEAGEKEKAE